MKHIIPIILFIFVIHDTLSDQNDKGHPIWWWELQLADLVAIANISYDPKLYITIESSAKEKTIGPQYYLEGKVKFKKIIYINKFSRFFENYAYYFKNPSIENKILIPAERVYFFSDSLLNGAKYNSIVLRPSTAWDTPIDNPDILIGLNQCYVFPISHLILDAVSPEEQINVMIELIQKRKNNFVETQ